MQVNVLSLFDGMACGMLAFQSAGINVNRYVAFEIDKYAVQTSSHNFPMIEHRGDVFQADFTEFCGFDFVLAGFPCTKFSIAQKNDRETKPYSGEGWLLFEQAWRAVCEAKPQYFIFENNKSMAKAVQQEISKIVGFEPVCINSARVSAQNRHRIYWGGKRNSDGTYSRVEVGQPEDCGILVRDVLDSNIRIPEYGNGDKARPVGASYSKNCGGWWHRMFSDNPNKQQVDMVAEPVASTVLNINPSGKGINGTVGRIDAKSRCLTTNKGEEQKIIVPVCVAQRGRYADTGKRSTKGSGKIEQFYEARQDGKTNTLTTVQKDNAVCCPVEWPFAVPVEWDENGKQTKAISGADGKIYPVYEVKDGLITIKGKQYPIKLADGFYIIRKLTVSECKRLQTVPEWYEFPVSDSQAYKMLGNGWTVLVISHLIKAMQANKVEVRLIDANELKNSFCKRCIAEFLDEPCDPSECIFCIAVDQQPTVEVVHVRMGGEHK